MGMQPDDERIRNGKYLVMNEKSLTPAEGSRALLRIESYGSPLKLRPERIIGHADDPGMDILSLLLDSGIDPECKLLNDLFKSIHVYSACWRVE